ncbi:MAG: hypothetical protein HZA53_08150 [Planctomycetes bacterium]|nr:hypothetical protein [Planctomycetota bacterium]
MSTFLAGFLRREGALAEVLEDGALECVLPRELCAATGLPEAPRLRLLSPAGAQETPLALESSALRACLERALARGQRASAVLEAPSGGKPGALSESLIARFTALNGSLRPRGLRSVRLAIQVLEFRYQAVGEERQEGSLFVAHEPTLGLLSLPLADELLQRLLSAEPGAAPLESPALALSAAAVERHVERHLRARLAPLCQRLSVRMLRDAERLCEYYDTLLSEATRRRRVAQGLEASAEKAAAIQRQREEKLRELAFRYAVEVRTEVASVLDLGYSAPALDAVLLRKQRTIPLTLVRDPFLREPLPFLCRGCGEPTLALHACDEAGHLTCAACAAPCAACGRVTCRTCVPAGCKVCTRT